MSHYHLEIVMPPTDDIEGAVERILRPFDENLEDDDEHMGALAFWDWYVIGGRWAGEKVMAKYDQGKLREFERWLGEQRVTVSGVIFGKSELKPESQQAIVDAKWQEMFPSDPPIPCPIFKHSGDSLPGDVQRLRDVDKRLKCYRVIVATPSYNPETKEFDGPPEAAYMIAEEQWNGVAHVKTAWNGKLTSALAKARGFWKCKKTPPRGDWLVVTVDYHS